MLVSRPDSPLLFECEQAGPTRHSSKYGIIIPSLIRTLQHGYSDLPSNPLIDQPLRDGYLINGLSDLKTRHSILVWQTSRRDQQGGRGSDSTTSLSRQPARQWPRNCAQTRPTPSARQQSHLFEAGEHSTRSHDLAASTCHVELLRPIWVELASVVSARARSR